MGEDQAALKLRAPGSAIQVNRDAQYDKPNDDYQRHSEWKRKQLRRRVLGCAGGAIAAIATAHCQLVGSESQDEVSETDNRVTNARNDALRSAPLAFCVINGLNEAPQAKGKQANSNNDHKKFSEWLLCDRAQRAPLVCGLSTLTKRQFAR